MKNSFLEKVFFSLGARGLLMWMPDKLYIGIKYWIRTGKWPNIANPKTFNEKLQWLKLYDRSPLYTKLVDKYEVKKYVADIIGWEYVIPTLGVWDTFDEIDFASLPNQFVLKCTHDSGGLVICRNKDNFNKGEAKKKINKSFRRNYYWSGREWPYKNVKPRIIAEQYMEGDTPNHNLNVYKIFTFDGEPKVIQTIQNDKQPDEVIDYFDTEWNLLKLKQNFPNSNKPLSKPATLDVMLQFARNMCVGHSFLRVDFYEIKKHVFFSEFTFYSDGGFAKFEPEQWDYQLGELIKLPNYRTIV